MKDIAVSIRVGAQLGDGVVSRQACLLVGRSCQRDELLPIEYAVLHLDGITYCEDIGVTAGGSARVSALGEFLMELSM